MIKLVQVNFEMAPDVLSEALIWPQTFFSLSQEKKSSDRSCMSPLSQKSLFGRICLFICLSLSSDIESSSPKKCPALQFV